MAPRRSTRNGTGERTNEDHVEDTPAVGNVYENGINGNQVPVGAVPAGDPAAVNLAVLQGIHGLQNLFGQLLQQLPILAQAQGVAGVQPQAQGAAAQFQPTPPPPPVQAPAQGQVLAYWSALTMMKDLGMETFSGGTDPVAADNWRKQLERNFETIRCPMEYRRELAATYLRGEALVWWDKVMQGAPIDYVVPWNVFRDEFNRKYFPREAIDKLEGEFLQLQQGSRTVREYEREFNRLQRFSGRGMTEGELVRKFLNGLRVDIRNRCRVRDYDNMIELVEKAALMEDGLEEEAKQAKAVQARTPRTAEAQRQGQDNRVVAQETGRVPACGTCGRHHRGACLANAQVCYKCGRPGHTKLNCPQTGITCHKCGKIGHITRDCRVRLGGPPYGNQNQAQLPPPPKRQATGPRMYAIAANDGTEPIAGTF